MNIRKKNSIKDIKKHVYIKLPEREREKKKLFSDILLEYANFEEKCQNLKFLKEEKYTVVLLTRSCTDL